MTDKDVQVCEVIVTKQLLRGNGNDDPYRMVTQVFTKDGDLIAENDSQTFCAMDLVHFGRHLLGNNTIGMPDVTKWLKNIQQK